MILAIEKLSNFLGALVSGVNLSQLMSDAVFEKITRAWYEYLLLVFRCSRLLQTDQPCRLRIDQRLSSGGGGQTQIGITCRRSHLCDLRCQVSRA